MEHETFKIAKQQAEKLLTSQSQVLDIEKDWYHARLREILVKLENFNQEMRAQYGETLSDILEISSLPCDIGELEKLINRIKQTLQAEKSKFKLCKKNIRQQTHD